MQMLEMFTDADPMRSDDYRLPADGWWNSARAPFCLTTNHRTANMTNEPESKTEVTSCQYFEALDRTYAALVSFDSLLGLSALRDDSDLSQKAGKIRSELWDLYQVLGAKFDSAMISEKKKNGKL